MKNEANSDDDYNQAENTELFKFKYQNIKNFTPLCPTHIQNGGQI